MGEYAIKYLCALYINVYVCVQLFFCAIKRKIPVFYMLFQEYSGISNRIPYEAGFRSAALSCRGLSAAAERHVG